MGKTILIQQQEKKEPMNDYLTISHGWLPKSLRIVFISPLKTSTIIITWELGGRIVPPGTIGANCWGFLKTTPPPVPDVMIFCL